MEGAGCTLNYLFFWAAVGLIYLERFELLVAFASWSLFFIAVLTYNFLTIQSALPHSHRGLNPGNNSFDFFSAASDFLMNIPRTFLSNWYGSLGTPYAFIPFCVVLLIALVCLTIVSPVEMPGEGWCEVVSLTGWKLFRKCYNKHEHLRSK